MATYNGARFLDEQLRSILHEMTTSDELIIVDDGSTDGTREILRELNDARVRIHENRQNEGHVPSFAKAIELAQRPYILLADQDDRWPRGRVSVLVSALRGRGAVAATSNHELIDSDGCKIDCKVSRLRSADSTRHALNILRIFRGGSQYFGCAMAFSRELKQLVLPIPRFVESHDIWIALASNLIGSNIHVETSTVFRRIHGNNVSLKHRSVGAKIYSRLGYALSLVVLWIRYRLWPGRHDQPKLA